jgi:hypothetical protein
MRCAGALGVTLPVTHSTRKKAADAKITALAVCGMSEQATAGREHSKEPRYHQRRQSEENRGGDVGDEVARQEGAGSQ